LRAPATRSADHDAVASDPLRAQLQTTLGTAYTLERELGGGEMSRVFVAHNTTLERNVVVKVLSPELAAGVSAEQFTREIKLAAGLQQANIVPLLSAGETDGLPFYTMPFVDGMSLRARLERNGAMPTAEAVSELRDVARALAYAHERGVVHRDIKPENILLSGEAAVVTDFGIAKALSASRTVAPGGTLTQVGTSIGTPAYRRRSRRRPIPTPITVPTSMHWDVSLMRCSPAAPRSRAVPCISSSQRI
jgi:eukaryotic-like serine/threonine-protein kinase